MNYYTADLHLDHKNILKFEPDHRPFSSIEEMNETLILNWNKVVNYEDDVYVLGDFAFCKGERANNFLDQLNGKKHLVIGNHDSFLKDNKFDRSKFVSIRHYEEVKDQVDGTTYDVILFHYPIAVWNKKHHGSIHLFGHIHSNTQDHHPLCNIESNSYNVGVDACNLRPVTLKELISKYGYFKPIAVPRSDPKVRMEEFQSNN